MTIGKLGMWLALQATGGYHNAFRRTPAVGPSMRGGADWNSKGTNRRVKVAQIT
jgi:hypothetical protein